MTRAKKELPKKNSEVTEDLVIEIEATVELPEVQNSRAEELHPQKQQQIIDQNAQTDTDEEPVDPSLYFFNRELSTRVLILFCFFTSLWSKSGLKKVYFKSPFKYLLKIQKS